MSNIYFYPKSDYRSGVSQNPYPHDFERALSKHQTIVNQDINRWGILDLFRYLLRADAYVLNWIENLPEFRYGRIQSILLVFFLLLAKALDRKIVWILHNKYSHKKGKNKLTDFMYALMMRFSDRIITHSEAGVDFVRAHDPGLARKVRYLIHPVKAPFSLIESKEKDYDLLIWGTVSEYKGIVPFLAFVCRQPKSVQPSILILGRCPDPSYKQQLEQYLAGHIVHMDQFCSLEEVASFARQSKFILFTYQPGSVLSSGSLMDSIRMGVRIIGPGCGAFKDLSSLSLIRTYSSFEEIIDITTRSDGAKPVDQREVERFCRENSWEAFASRLEDEFRQFMHSKTQTQTDQSWPKS